MEASTYRNFEIIVVDNGSSEKNRRRIELMLSLMTPECGSVMCMSRGI